MIDMLSLQKNLERSLDTLIATTVTKVGKGVFALFATRGYECLTLAVRLPVLTTLLSLIYRSSPFPLPCSLGRLPARANRKITTPWDREDHPMA